jgi:pimeloyl-ACP methyl ester carboxylesterase
MPSREPEPDLADETIASGPGDPPSEFSPLDFPNAPDAPETAAVVADPVPPAAPTMPAMPAAQPAPHTKAPAATERRGTVKSIHYALSYIVRNGERGPRGAVVLLHDLPGGAFTWADVLPQLDAAGRAVYAFDMLGYGQSEYPWPSDTSIWGHADCLAPALRRLELSDITLVGIGVGAAVAQVLATRMYWEGIGKLVLINSYGYEYAYAPGWPLPEMEKRHDPEAPKHTPLDAVLADLRTTLPSASARPKNVTASKLDAYVNAWRSEIGKEMLFQHVRLLVPSYMNSVGSDLRKLAVPVLLIWSAADDVTPVRLGERMAREIPGARLETLRDAGHMALDDAPEAVGRLIAQFASAEQAV